LESWIWVARRVVLAVPPLCADPWSDNVPVPTFRAAHGLHPVWDHSPFIGPPHVPSRRTPLARMLPRVIGSIW
jgi:hypothetical protein